MTFSIVNKDDNLNHKHKNIKKRAVVSGEKGCISSSKTFLYCVDEKLSIKSFFHLTK